MFSKRLYLLLEAVRIKYINFKFAIFDILLEREKNEKIIEFTEEVPFEEIMKYPGEYYAIVDHKIVAHGKCLDVVLKEAEKFSPNPLIGKDPTHEIVVY